MAKPRDKIQGVLINPDKPQYLISIHSANQCIPKRLRAKLDKLKYPVKEECRHEHT